MVFDRSGAARHSKDIRNFYLFFRTELFGLFNKEIKITLTLYSAMI